MREISFRDDDLLMTSCWSLVPPCHQTCKMLVWIGSWGLRQETPTTHGAGCLTTDMGRFIPDQSATYFFRGIAASPVMMKRAMLPFCVNMAAELFNANLWCFPSLVSIGTGPGPCKRLREDIRSHKGAVRVACTKATSIPGSSIEEITAPSLGRSWHMAIRVLQWRWWQRGTNC